MLIEKILFHVNAEIGKLWIVLSNQMGGVK